MGTTMFPNGLARLSWHTNHAPPPSPFPNSLGGVAQPSIGFSCDLRVSRCLATAPPRASLLRTPGRAQPPCVCFSTGLALPGGDWGTAWPQGQPPPAGDPVLSCKVPVGTRQGSRCVHGLLDHVPSAWLEVVLGQEVEKGDRWGAAAIEGSPITSLPASPWLCSSSSSQLSSGPLAAPSSADGCPAVPSSAWRGWACVWNELVKAQIWGG